MTTETTYKNRYRELITFVDDGVNTVTMSGFFQGSIGLSGGKVVKGRVTDPDSVDASGGPFIAKGQDLNEFFRDGKKRIVTGIELGETITLKYS